MHLAHNGLDKGSSPLGLTSLYNILCPQAQSKLLYNQICNK